MSENSPKPRKIEEDERLRELIASGASLSEIAEKPARAEAATKARPEPGPHASPKLSVNKITWAQVGLVTEPGRYVLKFGVLTITAEDLAVWQKYPNAEFTLFRTATTETGEGYGPGTFDLRTYLSLSEK